MLRSAVRIRSVASVKPDIYIFPLHLSLINIQYYGKINGGAVIKIVIYIL